MKTKAADYPSLGHLFFDESIRLDTIIWIAACSDQPPKAFRDFIDEEDRATVERVLGVKLRDGTDPESVLSTLARANRQGFIVQAATPVPQQFHDGGGFSSYGFGHAALEWFYTDALDATFAERLLQWRDDFIAKERKRRAKKSPRAKAGN